MRREHRGSLCARVAYPTAANGRSSSPLDDVRMTQPSRLLGGLAAAWAAVVGFAFVAGAFWPIWIVASRARSSQGSWDGIFGVSVAVGIAFALFAATVAAAVGLTVGVPLFRFLRRKNYRSVWVFLGFGLPLSVAAAGLIFALRHFSPGFLTGPDLAYVLCIVAAAGQLAAFTIFRVAKRAPVAASSNQRLERP